jgi:hypothetical protein
MEPPSTLIFAQGSFIVGKMPDCEGVHSMSETKSTKVKLDWSRLLGFDQADPASCSSSNDKLRDPRLAKLGPKEGVKPGAKFGIKVGIKLGIKGGIKVST